jgi:hypothetical protein
MRRQFGFNKKICRKSLIVYVYYQPNSCTMYHTPAEHWWAGETFLRQRKKSSSSPRAAGVISIEASRTWWIGDAKELSLTCHLADRESISLKWPKNNWWGQSIHKPGKGWSVQKCPRSRPCSILTHLTDSLARQTKMVLLSMSYRKRHIV